ncbi:MAG TPA: HDOD domain-containing protein [Dissulfurispiraceae bacterium]|nr:HDOD domain-containing protein [Dissulfurispiraceae bacterium]
MTVFERIEELKKLPTLPENLGSLIDVLNNESASIRDLEKVIRRDQSVAARLITVANSPAFGHAGFINSIEQAILVLGFDLVRSIAVGVSIFQSFPIPRLLMKHLWAHAYCTGLTASLLSQKMRRADKGVCFLGGLLHDIGRIVFLTLFPKDYSIDQDADWLIETEIKRFGCSHPEAGGHFLHTLNVPDEVAGAVSSHHTAVPDNDNPHRDAFACVYLAEGMQQIVNPSFACDSLWTGDHQTLLESYGLGVPDLETIAVVLRTEEQGMIEFLDI